VSGTSLPFLALLGALAARGRRKCHEALGVTEDRRTADPDTQATASGDKALLCGARIRPTFVQNRCLVRASWDHEMHTHLSSLFPTFCKSASSPEIMRDPDCPPL
jgi:hypothetical protein